MTRTATHPERRSRTGLRRGRGRAGFLMVEALATLAISAFILTALATMLNMALRAADRTAAAVSLVEQTGRAILAVERELRVVARVRFAAQAPAPFVFAGSPDRITFVTHGPSPNGMRRGTAVTWRSFSDRSGSWLTRQEAPLVPGLTSGEALNFGRQELVSTGAQEVRFAYFGPAASGPGEVLVDTWTNPQRMPNAIRLSLIDPGSRVIVSSVRIPIRVDAEPACVAPEGRICSLVPSSAGEKSDRPEDAEGADRKPGARGNRPDADGETRR